MPQKKKNYHKKERNQMPYFDYHATAKKLIREGKLISWHFAENHNGIPNAIVLHFRDEKHPVMPIRAHRHEEYLFLLEKEEQKNKP